MGMFNRQVVRKGVKIEVRRNRGDIMDQVR